MHSVFSEIALDFHLKNISSGNEVIGQNKRCKMSLLFKIPGNH